MTDKSPPAFPVQGIARINEGMSLRDWFAGQAMAAGLTGHKRMTGELARESYLIADAMIAERDRHD